MGFLDNFVVDEKEQQGGFLNQFEIEPTEKTPQQDIGSIAQKYESGGDVSAISSGVGDYGGKSYGPYQLSSKIQNVNKFLGSSSFADEFKGLGTGSVSFDRKWKELSQNPQFIQEQKQFVLSNNYNPIKQYLKNKYKIDIEQSPAIRELVFSTSNQFGPELSKKVFDEALSGVQDIDERGLIDKVTNTKLDTSKWFKSSSYATQIGVADRFEKERADLYNLISKEVPQEIPKEITFDELFQRKPEEQQIGFGTKAGRSIASSLYGIESGIAASPGLLVDTVAQAANLINKGINAATDALFGKKFFSEQLKAPKELYDIGKTISEKVGAEGSFLEKSFSTEELKKQQQQYSESTKMAEKNKGIVGSLIQKIKEGKIKEAGEYITLSTIENAPQNILAAIASIVTKNPKVGLAILAGTSASNEMYSSIENDQDRLSATINAINNGLMEYGGEVAGTMKILAPLRREFLGIAKKEGMKVAQKKATNFATKLLMGLTGEVKSELITQAGQDLGKMFTGTEDITLERFASNLADAGLMAVTSTGPLVTISSAIEGKEVEQARETTIEQPTEKYTKKSFWNTGSPEAFVEKYNSVKSSAKQFMMKKLTDEERSTIESLLDTQKRGEKPVTTVEATPTMPIPTEEVVEAPVKSKEEFQMEPERSKKLDQMIRESIQGLTEEERQFRNLDEELSKVITEEQTPEVFQTEEKTPGIEVQRHVRPKYQEGEVSDQEDQIRVPSNVREGEISVKEKPIEETSSEETETSGVVQTPSKKEIIKYSVKDLIDIAQSDKRTGPEKVKDIATKAGIKIPKNKNWQTFALEYAKKFGNSEDIETLQSLKEQRSTKISEGKKQAPIQRLKETGDERTLLQRNKAEVLKEIEDNGIVEYNKDKHSSIISSLNKDKQGNYKPVFINKEYNNALTIETINGKPYISIKETTNKGKTTSGLDILQDIEASSRVTEFKESVKNIEETEETITEKSSKELTYDQEKVQTDIDKVRERLDKDLKSGKIDQTAYDVGLKYIRAMEQEEGLADYKENFDDLQFSKELSKIDPNKPLDIVDVTPEQNTHGQEIAKKFNLIYNGGMQGLSQEGKIVNQPHLLMTDKVTHDTFSVPVNATEQEVLNKINTKQKEFKVAEKFKEVTKPFKNLKKEDVPNVIVSKVIPEHSKIIESRTYGVLAKLKNGKHTIVLNPDINIQEELPTLIHEMWGHFGTNEVIEQIDKDLAQYANDLFVKQVKQNDPLIQSLVKSYGNNRDVVFKEWLAKNIEKVGQEYFDKDGKFIEPKYNQDQSILKKVYDFIKTLVDKVFKKWFGKSATQNEIDDMAKAIIQKFGEVRGSQATTAYSRKLKKPKKAIYAKKNKLRTYANDRLNLNLATNPDDLQVRFFDFANKHFYGKRAESFRRQIFDLIDKVVEIGDTNYKKLMKTIDEFSDWEDAELVYEQYKDFKSNNRKLLSKSTSKTDQINNILNQIDKKYQEYLEYQSLKRLKDRGIVDRPFKKGTEEYTTPGYGYQNLLDKGYVEKESFEAGSYELSDKGKQALVDLTNKLRNEENQELFGAIDIQTDLDQARQLLNEQRFTNKSFKVNKKTTISKAVEDLVNSVKEMKPSRTRKLNTPIKKLVNYIKRRELRNDNLEYITNMMDDFTKGAFTKYIFDPSNAAREKTLGIGQKITDYIQERLGKIPKEQLIRMSPTFQSGIIGSLEKATTRKPDIKSVKLQSGKSVKLTPSQRISIYMLSKNDNSLRHLLNGGMSLTKNDDILKLTSEDIENINNTIDKNEKIVADTFFAVGKMVADDGNIVSNVDVGFDIFGEDYYHPMMVRTDYVDDDPTHITNSEQLRQHIIRSTPSALKKRVKSNAPLIIEGVFESFARTLPMVEKYIGSTLHSKAVESILLNKEFKREMYQKGFDEEYNMIKKIFDEQYGNILRQDEPGARTFRAVQNLFTTAVLGYKASVALIQPTSYLSYIAAIDGLDMNKKTNILINGWAAGINNKEYNRIKDLIWKYSPSLRNRFEGHFDQAIGEAKKSAEARGRFFGGKKGIRKALSSEGAMEMIAAMDQRTVAMVWKAVEKELQYKGYEKGNEKFDKAVAKRTSEVIRQTQATYDPLDRPLIMNSMILKPLTMFTSESVKRMLLVKRALNDIRKGNVEKGVTNLTMLMVIQPLMIEAIRTGILAARGKGDMPEDPNEFMKWLVKRIAINNVGLYPILGTMIASFMQDYAVNIGGSMQELITRIYRFGKNPTIDNAKRLSEIFGPVQSFNQAKDIIEQTINKIQEY